MATNFEKFRSKMEQAKAKKSSANPYNWKKLDAGKRYPMRFLPLKSEGLELPISIFHHHSVTFPDGHYENIACPKRSDGTDCPFCTLASNMYKKFVSTEDLQYKEAFKKLVAKTHYLLVGYDPTTIEVAQLKVDDLEIVRASSKSNMELIESKLAKEIDFVDFKTGRNVELFKSKGSGKNDITTIMWDFDDPSVAFSAKDGKAIWDQLIELSPDLTPLVQPMDPEKLAAKFAEFSAQPIHREETEEEEEVSAPVSMLKPKTAVVAASDDAPFDIDALRAQLED